MNKYLFFSLLVLAILPIQSLPALSHGDKVHTIVETSEESKQKIQECLALPEFQDSCYIELCGEEGTYLCTENILDAVVDIADPQTAMDVLNGIMQSSLFAIQTDGHLLSHVIGNAIAHHYGFSGDSMLLCPEGFNWGCTHGFFEDALVKESDPVKAAAKICESLPERPIHRKSFCYHGVGHVLMFNESYNLMSALSLCDEFPTFQAQDSCYQGTLMENADYILIDVPNGYTLKETKAEQGFLDNDFLAPCSILEDRYRSQCYVNHGYYLLHQNDLSLKDASHECLGAGDYINSCITGLAIMTSSTGWQRTLIEANPIIPHRETTFIERFAYLCDMVPPDYIEHCQRVALAYLMTYDAPIEDAIDFCILYGVNKGGCFEYMGIVFNTHIADFNEIRQYCEMVPEEFQDDCMEGAQVIPLEKTQSHQDTTSAIQDTNKNTDGGTLLPYLFIGLGSILMTTPLVYYFYRKR